MSDDLRARALEAIETLKANFDPYVGQGMIDAPSPAENMAVHQKQLAAAQKIARGEEYTQTDLWLAGLDDGAGLSGELPSREP